MAEQSDKKDGIGTVNATDDSHTSHQAELLRTSAEERLVRLAADLENLPKNKIARLLHDLEVHQVELEMQNDELRRTQLELIETKDQYVELYENAPSGYLTLTMTGRVLKVNLAGTQLLGVPRDNVLGVPFHSFLNRTESKKFEAYLSKAFRTRTPQSCVLAVDSGDSGLRYFRLATTGAIQEAAGEVRACHSSLVDISERIWAELDLTKHRDELEVLVAQRTAELEESQSALHRADRLGSLGTLAAGIAHELNNPLGMIQLRAEVALLDDDADVFRETLSFIVEQVHRSAKIVRGVLHFTRDDGSEQIPVDFVEIVLRAVDLTQIYSNRAGVNLKCNIAPGSNYVMASATEIEQVVVNLIRNAIEASSRGSGVAIELPQLVNLIRLTITDEGEGMTDEVREHVFDPFYTTKRDSGGTGLGLSIAHGIVAQHKGTIKIQSELTKGTSIALELPAHNEA
jgi:two-component system cell cycle sensor histidine kinase/response regulator CckA